MSRMMPTYEELVAQNKSEMLNDEQYMDEFEERFEEHLARLSEE